MGNSDDSTQDGVLRNSPKTVSLMPSSSNLSRPMVALKNLKSYSYRIKRIQVVESETGKRLNPRSIEHVVIYPIESKYWILFTDGDGEAGLPLPLQDIQEVVKKVTGTTNIISGKQEQLIELSFIGNKFLGGAGISLVATMKVEEKFVNEIYEKLRTLKQLQYDYNYWLHHSLSFRGESKKVVDIYPRTPFLADGEEMIWQALKYEIIDNDRKVAKIDAITNYRVFQYDYKNHHGAGILLPNLEDKTVVNERPTLEAEPVGTYFVASFNLTGIKEVGTNKIVGDITFYAQGDTSITFIQITDPEMLSTALRRLKDKRAITRVDDKGEISIVSGSELNADARICSSCQHSNPPGSNFCNKCGTSLTAVCKCGLSNPSGSLFCSQCGSKLSQ